MIKQITAIEFKEMYRTCSIKEMSKKLGVCTMTIIYWRNKLGLPLKNPGLIKTKKK